ncbi:MAG: hypothetical protein E7420_04620 [Ruminococcaceae bacterium]|nr:hypothetical protein [Oscillospiraceae bacterium]
MASRIIHLAVADALLQEFEIDNIARFRLGSILPDAKIDSLLRAAPHFQTVLPSGLITYRLSEFLSLYGKRIKEDSLYLGYYLHLIQDVFYRRYMYSLPHWDARIPENIKQLHSDYRKINRYIIESRALKNGISLPADFSSEDINLRFDFDAAGFLRELEKDFTNIYEGEYHHFTPEMADEYLSIAIDACRKELRAIRKGLPLLDEIKMAWGKE